jgi:cold shock CspA family protein/ribosome-associated translation inhibitor RaiA
MTANLQLTFRGFPAPLLAEERIRTRVERLEHIYPRITGCHVVAENAHRRHHKGKLYAFRIDLTVPGDELIVNREHHDKHAHEDFFVAMRDSFDAMEHQLRALAARQRGEVKAHETPPHGVVSRLLPDHGFISTSDGGEIYFHANSVADGKFAALGVGSEVRFAVAEKEGEKGPQASVVHAIGKHHLI